MNEPIRITSEPWMQAGAFTEAQWALARPLVLELMSRRFSFDEAVALLVRLRNNPPKEDL